MEARYRELTRALYDDITLQAFVTSSDNNEPYEVARARLLAQAEARHDVVIKIVMAHGPYKGRWLRASLADEYTRQYPVPGRASPSEWDVDMAELALEEAYKQAALFHFLDSAKEPEALNVD